MLSCAVLSQALVGLKRAVDEVVIPAVAKANIRDRITALTRRCLDAQKVGLTRHVRGWLALCYEQ